MCKREKSANADSGLRPAFYPLGGKSKAAVDGNWSLTFTDSGDKNGGNET
jgi:hypothetical protein